MNIVVYGATSAIVKETLRHYATEGHNFFLVARNEETRNSKKRSKREGRKLCKRLHLRSNET